MMRLTTALVLLLSYAVTPAVYAADGALIPRRAFFEGPLLTDVQLSPDGTRISYLKPVKGVRNLFIAPAERPLAGRQVTFETSFDVAFHLWTYGERILWARPGGSLRIQDLSNDAEPVVLWEATGVEDIIALSDEHPDEALVVTSDEFFGREAHRLHLGELRVTETVASLGPVLPIPGWRLDVPLGYRSNLDGSVEIYGRRPNGRWDALVAIPFRDSLISAPLHVGRDADVLYMLDSRGRDKAALVAIDMATGKSEVIASDERADIDYALFDARSGRPQAVTAPYLRQRWIVTDDSIAGHFAFLRRVAKGDIFVLERASDDSRWLVKDVSDTAPARYLVYDTARKAIVSEFSADPALDGLSLAAMHPREITARDGLVLTAYVTVPVGTDPDGDGVPKEPLPTILLIHGGPWARDRWGYDARHQFYANRGYAVLSVNYRGSTGFGKRFTDAGDREFSGKMREDIEDAMNWAVAEAITHPERVAITGASFGGYLTLVGLTETPGRYACGVDEFGVSDLEEFQRSFGPNVIGPHWRQRGAPLESEVGRRFWRSQSPLFRADRIESPLLIAHGALDARVELGESDRIVEAMHQSDVPVTYLVFRDEGHGFRRPANRVAFMAVVEGFLAECLGGRHEPLGDAFDYSEIIIEEGREHVRGLDEL